MTIRIEQADADDAAAIAVLVGELLHEIMEAVNERAFEFDHDDTMTRLRSWMKADLYTVLLARAAAGRNPVGCLTLSESRALYAEGAVGNIPEFFVRPAYRSRGVGTAPVTEAMRVGRTKGWRRLEATTPPMPQFERTMAFYQHHGFCITGGRKLKVMLS